MEETNDKLVRKERRKYRFFIILVIVDVVLIGYLIYEIASTFLK